MGTILGIGGGEFSLRIHKDSYFFYEMKTILHGEFHEVGRRTIYLFLFCLFFFFNFAKKANSNWKEARGKEIPGSQGV